MNVRAVRRVLSREVNGAEKQVKCSPTPPTIREISNASEVSKCQTKPETYEYSLAYLCISVKGVIGSKSFSHNFSQPFDVERVIFVYE